MQANTQLNITISDAELLLVHNPKLLGVYLDTFLSVNVYCVQVTNRVIKQNNVFKALAGTNCGQQNEMLLLTYKTLGRSNYAAPVWGTNASDTSFEKIKRTQNEALRIITGSHKMSSIDHLHSETKILQVEAHVNLLSAQYLVQCLNTDTVCHHITTMDHPPREMKETLFTRHNQTVLQLLSNTKKDSLQAIHTPFVNRAIDNMTDNIVLNIRPPPLSMTRVPTTPAYKRWNCQVTRPANCCHLIPSNRFLDGFPVPSQFAAAKLTYSTMPHRPSDSSRPRQRLLLSGDVHQNPGPATKYPCSVCTSNVTSRGVSYMCNRCSGWVHSKCSGLQNAAEYRRIKNWACISCSSPPTPQIPKPLPSPITPITIGELHYCLVPVNYSPLV